MILYVTVTNISTNSDEKERNRQQILEISHFFDIQQEELSAVGLPQPTDLADIDLDLNDFDI